MEISHENVSVEETSRITPSEFGEWKPTFEQHDFDENQASCDHSPFNSFASQFDETDEAETLTTTLVESESGKERRDGSVGAHERYGNDEEGIRPESEWEYNDELEYNNVDDEENEEYNNIYEEENQENEENEENEETAHEESHPQMEDDLEKEKQEAHRRAVCERDLLAYCNDLHLGNSTDGMLRLVVTSETLANLNDIVTTLRQAEVDEWGSRSRLGEMLILDPQYRIVQRTLLPLWNVCSRNGNFNFLEKLLFIFFKILLPPDEAWRRDKSDRFLEKLLFILQSAKSAFCSPAFWKGLHILKERFELERSEGGLSKEDAEHLADYQQQLESIQRTGECWQHQQQQSPPPPHTNSPVVDNSRDDGTRRRPSIKLCLSYTPSSYTVV